MMQNHYVISSKYHFWTWNVPNWTKSRDLNMSGPAKTCLGGPIRAHMGPYGPQPGPGPNPDWAPTRPGNPSLLCKIGYVKFAPFVFTCIAQGMSSIMFMLSVFRPTVFSAQVLNKSLDETSTAKLEKQHWQGTHSSWLRDSIDIKWLSLKAGWASCLGPHIILPGQGDRELIN